MKKLNILLILLTFSLAGSTEIFGMHPKQSKPIPMPQNKKSINKKHLNDSKEQFEKRLNKKNTGNKTKHTKKRNQRFSTEDLKQFMNQKKAGTGYNCSGEVICSWVDQMDLNIGAADPIKTS
jgi:hypothetical protein